MSLRWLPCFHKEEDHGRIVPMWELRSPDGGETRPAPWMGTGDHVMAWSPDGRYAFLEHDAPTCFRVLRVDVATGRREPWLESAPPDPSGIKEFTAETALTPDGRYYAYGYTRTLSDLFLVEGVR